MKRLIVAAATALALTGGFTLITPAAPALANSSKGITGTAECTTATWAVRGDDKHDGIVTASARGLFDGVTITGGDQVSATEPIAPGQTLDMWVAMKFPAPTPKPKGWVDFRPATKPVHVTGSTDCEPTPPVDVCPDLPGDQPEGTDCTPPPVDVCEDLEGNQPEGTDCTPVVVPPVKPEKPSKCGTPRKPHKPCPRDTHVTGGPSKPGKDRGLVPPVHQSPPKQRQCEQGQVCLPPTGAGDHINGLTALALSILAAGALCIGWGRRRNGWK